MIGHGPHGVFRVSRAVVAWFGGAGTIVTRSTADRNPDPATVSDPRGQVYPV